MAAEYGLTPVAEKNPVVIMKNSRIHKNKLNGPT